MANLKFSQFTEQTDTANVQFLVGYNGSTNVRIAPGNIGGTVTSVTTGDSNTITIGGTAADPTVAANTAAVTNGSLNLATGDQIYDFVINQGYTTNTGTVTDFDTISTAIPGITTAVANSTTTPELTISITGTPTSAQYLDGTGNWSTPAGGGSGTVTSVAATHAGNAFTASIGNVSTVNPSVDITLNGSASQYIDGAGNLTTFPTITTGTVESVGLSMPVAFSVANSPVTTSGTLTVTGAGTTSQYIDGTGALQTFPTIPTVPANIVETVTTTDGTFIDLTPNTATDGAVTVTADLSATGTPNASSYLRGDNTWATIPGGFTSFDITGTSGTAQTITDGNTITLTQGTGISTVAGATDTITITNTDRGSSQNIFKNVASDSGTAVADNNNDTLTIAGGTNVSTAVVGDTLTITATDTNTTYTAGTGLTLSGTVFNTNVDGTQTTLANPSTTTASRTYKVQVDSSDNLVVNVPWTSGSGSIAGSLADDQVAFGNGTDTVAGTDDFAWNGNTLTLGGSTGLGNLSAILITGDALTSNNNINLGTVVQHQGDIDTKFGFPIDDTFTIDTNGSERMRVASTGAVQLNAYGSGTFTGTAAYALSVDSSGNIIETTGGAAAYPFSTAGVNSLYSGYVPSGTLTGSYNTTLGIEAGENIEATDDNTLIGSRAARAANLRFEYNTVVGSKAFEDANGVSSTVSYNTVIGASAGLNVVDVVNRAVFVGYKAGAGAINSTGATGIGSDVQTSAAASFSVAVGYRTQYSNSYAFTTAIGSNAAYSGGGSYGTHVGYEAGRNITGQNNTCIGRRAGYQGTAITTGSKNTIIGSLVTTSSSSLSNATAIGYSAADNGNNTVTLGDTFITGLHCQVQTISSLSDSRDKTNIQKSSYGLDIIEKLNPVTFEWDQRDGGRKGLKDLGFIAQELQESDDEYLQLVNSNDPEKLQASYGRLIPVMIKAIQELQEEIKYLKNK